MQNPIGLHPDDQTYFPNSHKEWSRDQRAERPELDESAIAAFGRNMWDQNFVFCVDRNFVCACPVPTFRSDSDALALTPNMA